MPLVKKKEFKCTINTYNEYEGVGEPLVFSTQRGITNVYILHKTNSNIGFVDYGIFANSADISLFEFNSEITNAIENKYIYANSPYNLATIKSGEGIVGSYTFSTLNDESMGKWSMQLDEPILKLQNLSLSREDYYGKQQTALYILCGNNNTANNIISEGSLLYNLSNKLNFNVFIHRFTREYLNKITIAPLFEEETIPAWDFIDQICKALRMFCYIQNDGKVRFLSQYEINSRQTAMLVGEFVDNINTIGNPIEVPYNSINGIPKIEKLLANKYSQLNCTEKNVKYNKNVEVFKQSFQILNDNNENIVDEKLDEGSAILTDEYGNKFLGAFITVSTNDNILTNDDIAIGLALSESGGSSAYDFDGWIFDTTSTKEDFDWSKLGLLDEGSIMCAVLNKYKTLKTTVIAVKHVLGFSSAKYLDILYRAGTYSVDDQKITYGNSNYAIADYTNVSFLSNWAYYESRGTKTYLSQHLYENIITDFNGKQIMTFTMAGVNLFDKDGNLHYNFNKEPIRVQIDNYTNSITEVHFQTDVEFEVGNVYEIVINNKPANFEQEGYDKSIYINNMVIADQVNAEKLKLSALDNTTTLYLKYFSTDTYAGKINTLFLDNQEIMGQGAIIQLYKLDANGNKVYDSQLWQVYGIEINRTGYPFVTITAVGLDQY